MDAKRLELKKKTDIIYFYWILPYLIYCIDVFGVFSFVYLLFKIAAFVNIFAIDALMMEMGELTFSVLYYSSVYKKN